MTTTTFDPTAVAGAENEERECFNCGATDIELRPTPPAGNEIGGGCHLCKKCFVAMHSESAWNDAENL
jgi:hypothetical protein